MISKVLHHSCPQLRPQKTGTRQGCVPDDAVRAPRPHGVTSVSLSVTKTPQGNTVEVSHAVRPTKVCGNTTASERKGA
jgi:hypothetical protein